LSFYKNLSHFDESQPVKPYLFKIAINQLKMFYRKRKKFLPLNKDIADEGGDFAIFNLFEEEEKIFDKLKKKGAKSFSAFKKMVIR